MIIALDEAKKGAAVNEIPVGAVVVNTLDNTIIARAHNLIETNGDPLLHAEMIVMRAALCSTQSKFLDHCALYVTLEPCNMCAAAISYTRIQKLYFAAYNAKFGAVKHNTCFFNSASCLHKPEIYSGILETESLFLLRKFFNALR